MTAAEPEYFGEFLARARIERNVSWAGLAAAAGVSISTIQRWLMRGGLPRSAGTGGNRTPPEATISAIARLLGYPADYVTACWRKTLDDCYPVVQAGTCTLGHRIPEGRYACPECAKARVRTLQPRYDQARRDRYEAITCTRCGKKGVERIRPRLGTGQPLCGSCYSRERYKQEAEQRQAALPAYKPVPSASGYRGVTLIPARPPRPARLTLLPRPPSQDRWTALITHKGRRIYLGSFATAEEAARAYDDAATRLKGRRACLNFPERAKRTAS